MPNFLTRIMIAVLGHPGRVKRHTARHIFSLFSSGTTRERIGVSSMLVKISKTIQCEEVYKNLK